MKNVLTLIIAGTMLASGAFAKDFAFEERFRAKVGRYTPAEEARRASNAAADRIQECDMPTMACCHRTGHEHTTAAMNPWLAAKLGTANSPASRMDCEHNRPAETLRVSDTWRAAKFGIVPTAAGRAKAAPSMTCCD